MVAKDAFVADKEEFFLEIDELVTIEAKDPFVMIIKNLGL